MSESQKLTTSARGPTRATKSILAKAAPLQSTMTIGQAAKTLGITRQRLQMIAFRNGLNFLSSRKRAKTMVTRRQIALPHDMAEWLLAQVPPGCDAVDVIIAIITDAYNEEKDK